MSKLLLAILTLIPVIGPLLYFFLAPNKSSLERIVSLLALIPGINFICAIILIIKAL